MKVKRKYLEFNRLLKDEKTRDLYEKITKGLNNEHLYEFTHSEAFLQNRIIDKTMEWALPGEFIEGIEKSFEELDQSNPYDTELSSEEINHIEQLSGPYPNLIAFYHRVADRTYNEFADLLVTVINLEEKDGEFIINN